MRSGSTVLACLATSILVVLTAVTPARAAEPDTDYVALGDSYSAGVGAPGQSGICLRSPNGYAGLWAARQAPKSFTLAACNGATTDDVRRFQIPLLSAATDLVTITVGGNDSGFVPAVATCTLSSDRGCADAVAQSKRYINTSLGAKLDSTYAAIRARSPQAEVVVLSYPRLFDAEATGCGPGGMSQAKRRSLNSGADELDAMVRARAEAAGFTFADVRAPFHPHGICSSSTWINPLTIAPITDSFHPNADGYAKGYLPVLEAALTG